MAATSGDTDRVGATREDGHGPRTYLPWSPQPARSLATLAQAVRVVLVPARSFWQMRGCLSLPALRSTPAMRASSQLARGWGARREADELAAAAASRTGRAESERWPGDCQSAMSPPCSASVPSASHSSRPGQAELSRLLRAVPDRRATSVQLATVTRGQPRVLTAPGRGCPAVLTAWIGGIPTLIVLVRFSSPASATVLQVSAGIPSVACARSRPRYGAPAGADLSQSHQPRRRAPGHAQPVADFPPTTGCYDFSDGHGRPSRPARW